MKKILLLTVAALMVAGSAFAATPTRVDYGVGGGNFGGFKVISSSLANAAIDTCYIPLWDAAWIAAADTASGTSLDFEYELSLIITVEGVTANADTAAVVIDMGNDDSGFIAGLSSTTFVEGTPQAVKINTASPAPLARVRFTNSDQTTSVYHITVSYPKAIVMVPGGFTGY